LNNSRKWAERRRSRRSLGVGKLLKTFGKILTCVGQSICHLKGPTSLVEWRHTWAWELKLTLNAELWSHNGQNS